MIRSVIFAFDPALNSPGGAVFVDGWLRAADSICVPGALAKLPMGARVDAVARLSIAWYRTQLAQLTGPGDEHAAHAFVYEKPTLYGGGVSDHDPDDMIHIGMVGSAVAALQQWATITAPEPKEWNYGSIKIKRNHPCIWDGQRGRQIARRLRPEERVLVPDKHDALDATGLGLFELGRMEPIRVNARRGAVKPA